MTITNPTYPQTDQAQTTRSQNICGGVFVFLYVINFVFRLLQYNDILPYGTIWINITLGVIGVIGFSLLNNNASSMAAEFFAVSQIGFEVFFSVAQPVLSVYFDDSSDFYEPVFWLSIIFSTLSVYFWCMLFKNVKFSVADKMWILLLPLLSVYNIAHYFNCISRINDKDAVFGGAFYDNDAMMILRLCLLPLLAIGYWKLAHTDAFSGPKEDYKTPRMSPLNAYFAAYILLVAAAYYAF